MNCSNQGYLLSRLINISNLKMLIADYEQQRLQQFHLQQLNNRLFASENNMKSFQKGLSMNSLAFFFRPWSYLCYVDSINITVNLYQNLFPVPMKSIMKRNYLAFKHLSCHQRLPLNTLQIHHIQGLYMTTKGRLR